MGAVKPWHIILVVVGFAAFLCDFQAGVGAVAILPQSVEWHLSPNHVNYANNLNVLVIGIANVFVFVAVAQVIIALGQALASLPKVDEIAVALFFVLLDAEVEQVVQSARAPIGQERRDIFRL